MSEQRRIQIGLDVMALIVVSLIAIFVLIFSKDIMVRLGALITLIPCAIFTVFLFTGDDTSGLK